MEDVPVLLLQHHRHHLRQTFAHGSNNQEEERWTAELEANIHVHAVPEYIYKGCYESTLQWAQVTFIL